VPKDPNLCEDFLHEFFLFTTHTAKSFRGSFIGIKDLHDDSHTWNWLLYCFRHYREKFWRKLQFRIQKEHLKQRAKEISIDPEETEHNRLEAISFELFLRRRRTLFITEQEELEDIEARRVELHIQLTNSMIWLSATERKIIMLFYFESLSIDDICKQLDISNGSVRTHLWAAKRKMEKELPPEIYQTKSWIRGDYRLI
jgi:RNA polymerase sigma factor (sigma-70 family)